MDAPADFVVDGDVGSGQTLGDMSQLMTGYEDEENMQIAKPP